jgi:phage-related protein
MYSKVRHILPEPKLVYEDLPGVDGEYDFSDVNPDGRTMYKPFVEEITFTLLENDSTAFRQKSRQIASWLACGEKVLVYEDEPNVYYLARVVNRLDIENQLVKVKAFTAQFKCKPFGYAFTEDTFTLNSIIEQDEMEIDNQGTYVKPIITIQGSFTTLVLTILEKTLTYNEALSNAEIVIDCEKMSCIKDGAINKNNKLSGSFLVLENGTNFLQISGTGLNCDISVTFRQRFL